MVVSITVLRVCAKIKIRDGYMNSLGLRVLRFSDRDVFTNMEGVMGEILKYL